MNAQGFHQMLVVLNVPVALEETVVDWLMARPGGGGFTSIPVAGHAAREDHLSPAEKVSGRQRRLQFQVQIDADSIDEFLDGARQALGRADVHYWVLPILSGGFIDSR